MDQDLGPLPTADDNSALQRESLDALRSLLGPRAFILRDERVEDFGVDLTLEVLAGKHPTNCRAQVQLKGRSNLEPNGDGSFSVSVPTSNLNYLLNGSCPLYILYRPEPQRFWLAHAIDETKRISELDESWKARKNVTIRFSRLLDEDAIEKLSQRMVDEAVRHRALRDTLAGLEPGRKTRLEINEVERPVTAVGPEDAAKLIATNGMSLVGLGFERRVLELAALLTPEQHRSDSRIPLVIGYANFSSGNYLDADVSLRRAHLSREALSEEDRCFLAYLRNSCALVFGELSEDDFQAGSSAWREKAPENLRLQYDLIELWSASSRITETQEMETFRRDLHLLAKRIEELPDLSDGIRHQVKLLKLFVAIQERSLALGQALLVLHEPSLWGRVYDEPPPLVLAGELRRLADWRAEATALTGAIQTSGNTGLFCQALFTRDICESFLVSQLQTASAILQVEIDTNSAALLSQIQATQSAAVKFEQVEIELRSQLLEAHVLDLLQRRDEAVELARRVSEAADALRQESVKRQADRIVAYSESEQRLNEIRAIHEQGIESMLAKSSEEELDRFAADACEMLRLPPSRLPIVKETLKGQQEAARMQSAWCRHFAVREWTQLGEDAYSEPVEHRVSCQRLGHVSTPSTSWKEMFSKFQAEYCASCTSRET